MLPTGEAMGMQEGGKPFTMDGGGRLVCGVCPSLRYPGGQFDVVSKPSRDCPFDPATGYRFTALGVPVCVHPERVGLPPAPYASGGVPLPWQTPPPASAADVPAWVRTAVAAAPPEACTEVIEQATKLLLAADPGTDVVAVLRAALG
ncbi:hypothetical protein SCATT_p10070 (plasmid) [Streptantibioticus cattleyicolor NRRL 8057 = DSM 46488]|uniref:Uncharacterized protein n=1 Tax=Streptantibioticus cattleyicolor (strain ATCC 35852 / DSM 46488 / JCM 4925 / NBRC 14057 / NRRL 8057) TaxID=1003195 RepID=F8JN48_STREN|nr:hypothetical protein SCATT_p10070 [Streptantibioticus cattleyicolor NRRL 8057 = DSM 46488]CCB71756.1 protein of unknown function [Streptantibioticus cattleyicolor NRRL 8057 = DSM 46488]